MMTDNCDRSAVLNVQFHALSYSQKYNDAIAYTATVHTTHFLNECTVGEFIILNVTQAIS